MTDYKQLCAELADKLDEFDRALHGAQYVENSLTFRARSALAKPEPEVPTDEELYDLLDWLKDEWHSNNEGEFPLPLYACAVLARWGNHPGSPDSST